MSARRLSALLVAGALVALLPTAAQARSHTFQDEQGDVGSSLDVQSVRVVNGAPGLPAVRVTVVQRELRPGDGFELWIDTVATDPGPEYRAEWAADSDILGLYRVTSFAGHGTPVDCPGFRVRGLVTEPRTTTRVLMPRPCLGNPHALRVGLRADRFVGHRAIADWAPGIHRFYGLVRQG